MSPNVPRRYARAVKRVERLTQEVGTILGLLAAGKAADDVLALYPQLEPEDVRAALAYAAWRVQEVEVVLPAR